MSNRARTRKTCNNLLLLGFLLLVPGPIAERLDASEKTLTVYSARNEHLIKPVFDAYEKSHGVKIRYMTDKAPALLQKLIAEGKRSKADVLLTVDAGNLWHAAQKGLFRPLKSKALEAAVPSHLRDPEGRWFGLSLRARTIAYSTKRVKPSELSSYAALGDKVWKKRLCLRTSKKVYNQSLVAMLISEFGFKKTSSIVRSWVSNLAAPVFANDTAVLEAIEAGRCDLGIVNSYYYARLLEKNANLGVALFWPNKANGGTHVNVSGAGVLTHAPHPKLAQSFIEWLVSSKAQGLFAEINQEFPVNPAVPSSEAVVKNWGTFDQARFNLNGAGQYQTEAIKLMDSAGYR